MIAIKLLDSQEYVELLTDGFASQGMSRQEGYYDRCCEENKKGTRITLFALWDKQLAGCCHLLWNSGYQPFANQDIPEINDLVVFDRYQRKGIATEMMDYLEKEVAKSRKRIGLGVGLYHDYGRAQRLYVKRGYIPDGKGLQYQNKPVPPGSQVRVDDDLVLFLTKDLGKKEMSCS